MEIEREKNREIKGERQEEGRRDIIMKRARGRTRKIQGEKERKRERNRENGKEKET